MSDRYIYTNHESPLYQGRIEKRIEKWMPPVIGATLLAAGLLVYGAGYLASQTPTGKARAAAEQKLSNVAMIPVNIDAREWRTRARRELSDAGIDLKVTGADPLHQLEYIAENANGGDKPWEKSGDYSLPDVNGDGRFGGLPMGENNE